MNWTPHPHLFCLFFLIFMWRIATHTPPQTSLGCSGGNRKIMNSWATNKIKRWTRPSTFFFIFMCWASKGASRLPALPAGERSIKGIHFFCSARQGSLWLAKPAEDSSPNKKNFFIALCFGPPLARSPDLL